MPRPYTRRPRDAPRRVRSGKVSLTHGNHHFSPTRHDHYCTDHHCPTFIPTFDAHSTFTPTSTLTCGIKPVPPTKTGIIPQPNALGAGLDASTSNEPAERAAPARRLTIRPRRTPTTTTPLSPPTSTLTCGKKPVPPSKTGIIPQPNALVSGGRVPVGTSAKGTDTRGMSIRGDDAEGTDAGKDWHQWDATTGSGAIS